MLLTRLSTNRIVLRAIWLPWILLPYALRKRATTSGIWALLLLKRALGVQRGHAQTPTKNLFSLSFWGVPRIAPEQFTLTVDGNVNCPLSLSLNELKKFPSVDRQVTLECVGGPRNIIAARGVSLATVIDQAEPMADVATAVFHCADGYFTTHPVKDLIETEAYLAYAINGEELPVHGYPLRLVSPGKYGYKWAKWVVRIELVPGSPMGYWEQRSLPDRAWVGDIR